MAMPPLGNHWSGDFLVANAFIGLHMIGGLLLGMLVGYERSYQGRAAGMRTYGLVCMASAALTAFVGQPAFWYGGAAASVAADPRSIVQGIVAGVGFLGAGVIMKDGLSISGLTTAASIWAASAIGVLVGVGFYAAALLLAVLCTLSMSLLRRLEHRLPGRAKLDVSLSFRPDAVPTYERVDRETSQRGYSIVRDTLTISYADSQLRWRFHVVALDRGRAVAPAELAQGMASAAVFDHFSIAPVRY
ncbi:MAG TPA: MgtC/SapB family protein [Casimicrobiaceae bacterium]|nr:MgtC/SapB family protein [Casimicrobiaceae bacterium]